MKSLLLLAAFSTAALAAPRNIVIDTDCGTDDLLAIAFLLTRADVNIEAITVVNGLAHVGPGAVNILRLLEASGHPNIPVYEGRDAPLEGKNAFPDTWRLIADAMPGIDLPTATRKSEAMPAAEFLAKRIAAASRPVSLLALGPLTNIAEALTKAPRGAYAIDDMVIMGGAVRVMGNVASGGFIESENRTAEWNFFLDPKAGRAVVESGIHFRLVPLDACNFVPVDLSFLNRFRKIAATPLGKLADQLLESSRTLITQNIYFAWDPLAAVALIEPRVLRISSVTLDVQLRRPADGRTLEGGPGAHTSARVALSADPVMFQKIFFQAFETAR
jgi:inosine-uridine nucleoside N-ribohydrolase